MIYYDVWCLHDIIITCCYWLLSLSLSSHTFLDVFIKQKQNTLSLFVLFTVVLLWVFLWKFRYKFTIHCMIFVWSLEYQKRKRRKYVIQTTKKNFRLHCQLSVVRLVWDGVWVWYLCCLVLFFSPGCVILYSIHEYEYICLMFHMSTLLCFAFCIFFSFHFSNANTDVCQ